MRLLLRTLLVILPFTAKADPFLNLGFNVPVYGSAAPKGWYSGGNGYTVYLDSVTKREGRSSVAMEGTGATESDFAVCTSIFPLPNVKGKSIKFTGYIKTENLKDGWAGLWWRVDGTKEGKRDVMAFDNMQKRGPKGTTEWQQFSIELEVSGDATNINFGCLMAGSGKAWFDDLEVYINGEKYIDRAPVVRMPEQDEINWMKAQLSPITSTDLNADDHDLEPIRTYAANAKVFALGEVTHGSSEIYKLKDRIIKCLVEKEGYDVFAIEANMPEAYKLNEYILQGKGDPKELIKGMYFWTWDTEEVLALVNWMKDYNDKHNKKVTFTGFDMQYSTGAFEELSRICKKYKDDAVIATLKKLDETLKDFAKGMKSYEPLSVKQTEFLKTEWKTLRDFAEKKIADKEDKAWFIQNVRILEQYTDDLQHSQRDAFMAENLLWIKEHNPQSKIIVWAHNAHIQRSGDDMGSHIYKALGNDYKTVGFTFYEGSYTATGKKGVTTYDAQPAYPGTYEYYFHQAGLPMFLFDMHKGSTRKESRWLAENLEFRETGAMKMANEFSELMLITNFDLVVFIDKSTNSTLLHPH